MKRILVHALFLSLVAGVTLRLTHSFFLDTAQSTSNVFAAAQQFPTATPTPSPTPTPTLPITPTPTPNQIANHIVISEVQINGGPGNTTKDFIELYNPTSSPIDLNGYRLVKRTGNSSSDDTIKSWTASTLIPAYGFYLWASNDNNTYPTSIGADTSTTSTIGSSNSIALRQGQENTGTIIDSLSWNDGSTLGEGTVFSPNPDANQSMERKASSTSNASSMTSGSDANKGNGFDTNNNSTDFILRSTSQPQNSSSPIETP